MITLIKTNFSKILFYLLSSSVFIGILLVTINFEKISINVFNGYYMFNAQHNPYYQLLLALIIFIFITYFILRTGNKLYINSWLIKVFVTLFVGALFEYLYFGLDQFSYAHNAIYYSDKYPMFKSGIGFVIRVNSFFTYIGGNSFYSLKIINTFVAFLSLVLFYKTYLHILNKEINTDTHNILVYGIFIMPTVLMWSSLIGKDSLILFPISLFIYSFIKIIDKPKVIYFIFIIISLLLAFYIRKFIPIIMIGTILIYNIKLNRNSLLILVGVSVLLFFLSKLVLGSNHQLSNYTNLFQMLGELQKTFSRGGSAMEVHEIKNLFDYIFYFIPNFFTAMFLPLPFIGTSNMFLWFFAFENVILLYLFVRYIVFNIKTILLNKYLRVLLIFIFCWSLIYVILSPGNLGTALRYKSQVLPILIVLILLSKYFIDNKVRSNNAN